jgi:zinc protease
MPKQWGRYVLGLVLLAAALPAAPGTLDPASIRETVLPSGLRLVVKEAHGADLVAVQVWVRAGGFLEDAEHSGYAHVIEHLVFKGSEDRGPGVIDQAVEELGGQLDALTEKDWTMFGTSVASQHAGKVIELMGETVRGARFRLEDLLSERPLIVEEIGLIGASPDRLANALLFAMSFQRHPYQRDARGAPPVVQRVGVDALKAYYQKYYVPANMTVLVVGDVNPATVEKQVRRAFGGDSPGSKGAPFTLPAPETACESPRREVVAAPFPTAFVGMSFPAPAVTDQPDVYAMDILVTMLENSPYGRLPEALKGKVGGVQASYTTRRQRGLLTVLVQCDPAAVDGVEKALKAEMKRLVESPPTQAEIDFTRRQLAGKYALENETFAGQANSLGFYAAIDRWQFATTYLDRVGKVTADEVLATAKKYLDVDHGCTLVLRPGGPRNPRDVPRTDTSARR